MMGAVTHHYAQATKSQVDEAGMVVAKIEFKRTGAPVKHILVKEGSVGLLRRDLRMITEEFEAKLASHDTVIFERLEPIPIGNDEGVLVMGTTMRRRGMTVIVSNSVESSDLVVVSV